VYYYSLEPEHYLRTMLLKIRIRNKEIEKEEKLMQEYNLLIFRVLKIAIQASLLWMFALFIVSYCVTGFIVIDCVFFFHVTLPIESLPSLSYFIDFLYAYKLISAFATLSLVLSFLHIYNIESNLGEK